MEYLISFYVFNRKGERDKITQTKIIHEEPTMWFSRQAWKEEFPDHEGCIILFCYMTWAVKEKA